MRYKEEYFCWGGTVTVENTRCLLMFSLWFVVVSFNTPWLLNQNPSNSRWVGLSQDTLNPIVFGCLSGYQWFSSSIRGGLRITAHELGMWIWTRVNAPPHPTASSFIEVLCLYDAVIPMGRDKTGYITGGKKTARKGWFNTTCAFCGTPVWSTPTIRWGVNASGIPTCVVAW